MKDYTTDIESRKKFITKFEQTGKDIKIYLGDGNTHFIPNTEENITKLKNINETARKLNISPDSVSYILHENNIQIISPQEVMVKKFGKEVDMFDLQGNYLKSFQSLGQAGNYMIENKLTNCKFSTIRYHIGEVCRGKRKTAGGFKWKYKNE